MTGVMISVCQNNQVTKGVLPEQFTIFSADHNRLLFSIVFLVVAPEPLEVACCPTTGNLPAVAYRGRGMAMTCNLGRGCVKIVICEDMAEFKQK